MDWSPSQTKLFRALLYCYPAEFRHEYAPEMEQLFADRLRTEPRWRLWAETVADVAFSAPKEHCAILASDLKHELRALRTIPGFTAIVLLVIALGIGATVSVFSLVNAVLLRSLPYGHPEQLVYVWSPNRNFKGLPDEIGSNVPDFYDWQRLSHSFSSLAGFNIGQLNLIQNSGATKVSIAWVTGNFFRTLEVKPMFGRSLDANDDQPGHQFVAVVSHRFWESHQDRLGEAIQLNRKSFTIVGVMPKDFGYPFDGDVPNSPVSSSQTDIWLPAAFTADNRSDRKAFAGALVIGRLRSGMSALAAQSELQSIEAGLQSLYEPMWRGWTALAKPLVPTILGPVQPMLYLLLGSVSAVLLIAVSNVAGLLLARTASRAHELGIRTALGAERARIIRQLLTESLLLSCAGGALGIALAFALVRLLVHLNPGSIPRFGSAGIDRSALFVAVALSVGAGLSSGIWPAIGASLPNVNDLLKRGGTRIAGNGHRGRFALIILEVALSVVLLTGSSLLIRSYLQLQSIDPGFSPASLTFHAVLDEDYPDDESQSAFNRRFLTKLRELPHVRYVGATSSLPLNNNESVTNAEIKGFGKSAEVISNYNVTLDYRQAIGAPLLRGRDFQSQDLQPQSNVAMINKAFAESFFHGHDPIGGQIRTGVGDLSNTHWLTVIAVLGDTRHTALDQVAKPQIFQPVEVADNFAVRSDLPVQQVATQIRAALRGLDPALTIDIKSMQERVQTSNARRTFQTSLLTGFAFIAVTLALVGLYGLMSYTVKLRTAEIGIRLAIGSPHSRVLSLILSQGMRLTAYGLVIGLAGAFVLTRLIKSWLFNVPATDVLTFALVPLFVLFVAAAACLVPAWSATRIDPMLTLRQE